MRLVTISVEQSPCGSRLFANKLVIASVSSNKLTEAGRGHCLAQVDSAMSPPDPSRRQPKARTQVIGPCRTRLPSGDLRPDSHCAPPPSPNNIREKPCGNTLAQGLLRWGNTAGKGADGFREEQ